MKRGAGHRRGGVHSFLSDDAETDEGVRTGQSVSRHLEGCSVFVTNGARLWTEWGLKTTFLV